VVGARVEVVDEDVHRTARDVLKREGLGADAAEAVKRHGTGCERWISCEEGLVETKAVVSLELEINHGPRVEGAGAAHLSDCRYLHASVHRFESLTMHRGKHPPSPSAFIGARSSVLPPNILACFIAMMPNVTWLRVVLPSFCHALRLLSSVVEV
jgi:hypothetical protein